MTRQANRAWRNQIGGREYDRRLYDLLVCPVNCLDAPILEKFHDLLDVWTSPLIFLILHGASARMHYIDLHLLEAIHFFQHSLILGRILVTPVAEEKRCKRYIFVRIAGECLCSLVPCFQTA